jgi:F0F1-type ATP synthase assembly protein I
MSNWMGARERNFDSVGLLLYRLAGLLVGFGIGLMVAHYYPQNGLSMSRLAMLLGMALIGLAIYRTKTAEGNRLQLRTK